MFADPCEICLVGYSEDSQAVKLKCGHMFHAACIIAWQENAKEDKDKCPTCKTVIGEDPAPAGIAPEEGSKKDDGENDEKADPEGGEEDQALISKLRSNASRRKGK